MTQRGQQSQLHIQFTTDVRYQEFLSDKKGARSSGSTGTGSELGQRNSREDLGLERPNMADQQTKERESGLASDRRNFIQNCVRKFRPKLSNS